MSDDFRAGLTDQDELSQYPSAANPLTAMGIDPDYASANPDILDQLSPGRTVTVGSDRKQQPAPAPSPEPSPKTAVSGDVEPIDSEGYGMQGLGQLSSSMRKAAQSAEAVQTTTPADVTKLTAQRNKLAIPAPRFDPKTGKELTSTQEYNPETGQNDTINPKASRGQKVWRGVRGGLVGLLTGGVPGAAVGALEPQNIPGGKAYNAPSKQYDQAEQRRQQELGSTDEGLKTAFQTWKDANEAAGKKASQYKDVANLGKDLTTGATGLINAEQNRPEAEARKGKAKLALSQAEFDQRRQQLETDPQLSKLTPLNKTLYMANGKVPDPKEPNEAEINASQIARAMTVFKAQHGGKSPQSLEEFNSVVSAAKGDLAKGKGQGPTEQQLKQVEDKKAAGIEKANSDYALRKFRPGAREEYQRQLQEIQNGYEADMSIFGKAGVHNQVLVDQQGHVSWKPETAQPSAETTGKPQPAPDGTRIQGSDGTTKVKRGGQWVTE